jgi:hypothetical protein
VRTSFNYQLNQGGVKMVTAWNSSSHKSLDRNMEFYDLFLSKNRIIDVVGTGFYGCSELWEGSADGRIVGSFRDSWELGCLSVEMCNGDVEFDDIKFSIGRPINDPLCRTLNRMKSVSDEEGLADIERKYYDHTFLNLRVKISDHNVRKSEISDQPSRLGT